MDILYAFMHHMRCIIRFENCRKGKYGEIGSLEVIKWAMQNTSNQSVDGFLYWASQGLSFYRKEAIRNRFRDTWKSENYAELSVEEQNLDISICMILIE